MESLRYGVFTLWGLHAMEPPLTSLSEASTP